jgi:hypothetical protein
VIDTFSFLNASLFFMELSRKLQTKNETRNSFIGG